MDLGQPIPAFTATATLGSSLENNRTIDSNLLKGKYVVLYFYPRDNTPGCTTEGLDFKALYDQFIAVNAVVIGVSRDTAKSHCNFAAKFDLPFPLIADPDETLCEQFGVMKNKTMYGKPVRGIERSTFVIDPQGMLRQAWRNVKVPNHAHEVLQAVQTLAQSN